MIFFSFCAVTQESFWLLTANAEEHVHVHYENIRIM